MLLGVLTCNNGDFVIQRSDVVFRYLKVRHCQPFGVIWVTQPWGM